MISPNRECSSFPIKIKIDKADVGLENVDNTSDLDKPISNAVRDYIDNALTDTKKLVTVDTTQNITGAKTFAGETTITGPFGVSGDTALTGKVTVEKELNVDSNGVAKINGPLTASNTGNSIKVANHDSALTSNDVLSAKDINEVNGSANNLVHRSGGTEPITKLVLITGDNTGLAIQNTDIDRTVKPTSTKTIGNIMFRDKISENNLVALYAIQAEDGAIKVLLGGFNNKNTWKAVTLLEIPWED